jgi:hypothetical protein
MAQDADEWPEAFIMDTTQSVGTVLADALEVV